MIATARSLAVIVAALWIAPAGAGQGPLGRIAGRVTDGSGAALPGVSITVRSSSLSRPEVVASGPVGQYVSAELPSGTYAVTFELPGFESRTVPAVQVRAGETFILDRQLAVASVAETVDVVAPAPVTPPPPRPAPPVRPRAAPVARELLASVCGPTQPRTANLALGRILGSQADPGRELFGDADVLMIDVGTDAGVTRGQNLVVRRSFRVGDESLPLKQASFGEGAAGLIQVVAADARSSTAVVVYACGEFYAGDVVEPFDGLPMWTAHEGGTPQFDDPGRVMFGNQGRTLGAPNELMVINRGALHGVARGQRVTIFRRPRGDQAPVAIIADAIVVAVREEAATIRIERVSDAVMAGDLVALHR